MEEQKDKTPQEENIPKFRGLYRHVKISVKALDWTIAVCVAVILIVFAFELRSPGFTVAFDAKGGSDVVSQQQMYGQKLELPEPPTREGYTFTGWYKDYNCTLPWDAEKDVIEAEITLYAGWQKNK